MISSTYNRALRCINYKKYDESVRELKIEKL